MKTVYAIALTAGLILASQTSFAKARPIPKPAAKCPAGQHWDKSMKMCMKN